MLWGSIEAFIKANFESIFNIVTFRDHPDSRAIYGMTIFYRSLTVLTDLLGTHITHEIRLMTLSQSSTFLHLDTFAK